MRITPGRSLFVVALIVVLTGCGGSGSGSLADSLNLNEDPSSTLLVVESGGGFLPVDLVVNQGPGLVLMRDGTLIGQGPQIEIFPGPLLANWQTSQLDQETLLFVLEELDAIGFDEIDQVENNDAANTVADAPTTTVTFYNQDGEHSFSVYALGLDTNTSDARVPILANLVQELFDAATRGTGADYQPERIQVVARDGAGQFDPADPTVNFRDWPLPLSFEEMGALDIEGWRCATFEGSEMEQLLEVFEGANQQTYWTEGEVDHRLGVRPLFSFEEPCAPTLS